MNPQIVALAVVWSVTALAVFVTFAVCVWRVNRLHRDFFFLFFFATTVVYLQLGPLLVVVNARPFTALERYVMPGVAHYLPRYAVLELACLLLFQVPLLVLYFGRAGARRPSPPVEVRARRSAALVAAGFALAPCLFLVVAVRDHMLFVRQLGGWVMQARLVGLPRVDFVVYRSYLELALFLCSVLVLMYFRSRGLTRWIAAAALAANVFVYGVYGILNSRSAVALLAVTLAGWWLAFRPGRVHVGRSMIRIGVAGVVALYLAIVAVNLRTTGWDWTNPVAFAPIPSQLLGDNQGADRINCIDLMARLEPEIEHRGAAWGAAWQNVQWIVRRFVDPEGFDRYRLSMMTSAKSYLMRRYLNADVTDYYSCSLVDLFGNFHVLGFVFGALLFGLSFRWCRRATHGPRSGAELILALFWLTVIIYFEQEAAVTLAGWLRKAPVLLAVLAARPFRVVPS